MTADRPAVAAVPAPSTAKIAMAGSRRKRRASATSAGQQNRVDHHGTDVLADAMAAYCLTKRTKTITPQSLSSQLKLFAFVFQVIMPSIATAQSKFDCRVLRTEQAAAANKSRVSVILDQAGPGSASCGSGCEYRYPEPHQGRDVSLAGR